MDYGTAYTAEAIAKIKGYRFDGWYTDSGCTAKFADGTAITADTDLFGRWTTVTGNLYITNKVTGDIADQTLSFPFKVEFDADGSYELRIYSEGEAVPAGGSVTMLGRIITDAAGTKATAGTVRSGDTIELAHGETAVIFGLREGTSYTVTETDTKGYTLTSTGASGTVAEDGSKASFINEKNSKVAGDTAGPDTGDYGIGAHSTNSAVALVVMQVAMLAMLLCVFCIKKLRHEDEAAQL